MELEPTVMKVKVYPADANTTIELQAQNKKEVELLEKMRAGLSNDLSSGPSARVGQYVRSDGTLRFFVDN